MRKSPTRGRSHFVQHLYGEKGRGHHEATPTGSVLNEEADVAAVGGNVRGQLGTRPLHTYVLTWRTRRGRGQSQATPTWSVWYEEVGVAS